MVNAGKAVLLVRNTNVLSDFGSLKGCVAVARDSPARIKPVQRDALVADDSCAPVGWH